MRELEVDRRHLLQLAREPVEVEEGEGEEEVVEEEAVEEEVEAVVGAELQQRSCLVLVAVEEVAPLYPCSNS